MVFDSYLCNHTQKTLSQHDLGCSNELYEHDLTQNIWKFWKPTNKWIYIYIDRSF
jgi:hypothetical protein